MIRLTDGIATVCIEMRHWDEINQCYTPDWSGDFFEVGSLSIDFRRNAYIVDDVNYCIEQAKECLQHVGDFYDGFPGNPGDTLFVDGDIVLEITEDDNWADDDDWKWVGK